MVLAFTNEVSEHIMINSRAQEEFIKGSVRSSMVHSEFSRRSEIALTLTHSNSSSHSHSTLALSLRS